MAMSKKETLAFEELKWALKVRGALRSTSEVKPDVPIPASFTGDLITGYTPVGSLGSHPHIEIACSSSCFHAVGRIDKTTSQRPLPLFSSKLLALRSLRYQVEQDAARALARIDDMIDAEEGLS